MKEILVDTLHAAKKAAPDAAGYSRIPGGYMAFETELEQIAYRAARRKGTISLTLSQESLAIIKAKAAEADKPQSTVVEEAILNTYG